MSEVACWGLTKGANSEHDNGGIISTRIQEWWMVATERLVEVGMGHVVDGGMDGDTRQSGGRWKLDDESEGT